jgi:uncharacterized protein (DUF433 family)
MEFENQIEIGLGVYTQSEISKILGLKLPKVSRWLNMYWDGKLGRLFETRYSWEVDKSKAVSFHTLVEFYVFFVLAEHGVSTKQVLKAHEELTRLFETAFPFAMGRVLSGLNTDGKKIYLEHEGSIVALDGTRQLNLDLIKAFFHKLEFGDDGLANKFWPNGKESSIVIDPERKLGHPVISESNIYPETIYSHIKAGDPVKYISFVYELSEKEVEDAIKFCKAA